MPIDNNSVRSPRVSSKGSTIVHTGTATAEIPVGQSLTYFIANSAASVGINWSTTTSYIPANPEVIYSSVSTASVSDVTISSIPSGYSSLILVISGAAVTTVANTASMSIQFNDSTTGYYYGSTAATSTIDTGRNTTEFKLQSAIVGSSWTSTVSNGSYGFTTIHIPAYASSSVNKSMTYRVSSANIASAGVGSWKNTSALTSIKIFPTSLVSFNSGISVVLYGTLA